MKRLAWLAGTALVVLLIAGGVLLLVGNLYVQSPAMQAKIRRELSIHLKMPAEARKTTLTPWDGLRIDGVTAPGGPGAASDAGPPDTADTAGMKASEPDPAARLLRLNARSFRARLAFGPLFGRREIVVREILFDTPDLSWAQTPEGRWRWPRGDSLRLAAAQEKHGLRAAELAEGRGSPPAATSSSPGPAASAGEGDSSTEKNDGDAKSARSSGKTRAPTGGKPTLAAAPVNVAIEGFRVRHGVAQFLDTRGEPYGRFEDINLDGRIDAPAAAAANDSGAAGGKDNTVAASAHGRLWFGRSSLRDLPTLTKFESAFAYTPEILDVTDGRGDLGGGVARVEYHLRHAEPGSPFQLRGKIEKVALGQLSKEIPAGAPRFLGGLLDGEVEMSGLSNSTASRTGRGQLRVVDAQLQNLPLLQTLGDYLRIPELSQLKLKTAQADCRLEGETLRIDPLVLGTGALRIEARGTCGLTGDQPLDLQTRLIIDRATSRGLSQFVDDIFTAVDGSTAGERYIDFRISGPLSNPRTDLLDRAVKSAKPLQDLIQSYVGGGGGKKGGKGGGSSATPAPSAAGGNNKDKRSGNNNSGSASPSPTAPTSSSSPGAAQKNSPPSTGGRPPATAGAPTPPPPTAPPPGANRGGTN